MTPDIDPDQISRQYLAGNAPSELARLHHCDLADIEAALTSTATPRRKRGGNRLGAYQSRAEALDAIAARNARILALHTEGRTVTEIIQLVGLQRAAVCKVLRAAHGKRPVATDAEIIALRQSGASVSEIVRTAHASHRRVTRVLAAAAMDVAPPDLTARNAEIIRRRQNGEHPKAIAASLEIAESTVYRALNGVADLPPLYQGARSRATKARSPKAPRPAKAPTPVPIVATPGHQPPVLLDRPVVPTPPKPKTHIAIRAPQRTPDSVDRYIAQLPPPSEPARVESPPCPVCGASHCESPLSHGRIARARAQHHWRGKKVA